MPGVTLYVVAHSRHYQDWARDMLGNTTYVMLQVPKFGLVSSANCRPIMSLLSDDGEVANLNRMLQRIAQVSLLFGCHS